MMVGGARFPLNTVVIICGLSDPTAELELPLNLEALKYLSINCFIEV